MSSSLAGAARTLASEKAPSSQARRCPVLERPGRREHPPSARSTSTSSRWG